MNAMALQDYGRPLFIAASADLANSTNLSGFGKDFGDMPGSGWYNATPIPDGALLPTEITEFTNAGMIAGLATVNMSADPFYVLHRILGRVFDVRLLQLPEVRRDAALQPARAGLRVEGRQGALGGRPLGSRNCRGLANPLRDLRTRGHATLSRRQGRGPAPVGVQRGAGGARLPRWRRTSRSSRCT